MLRASSLTMIVRHGELHGVYKTDITDYNGYTNFYRQDRYRTVAYFIKNSFC